MNDRALRLLEQYDLEVLSARRGRGAYILDTSEGLLIFSDYSNSEHKAAFQNLVVEKLRESGYSRVDRILPDKEGRLTVRDWEDNQYVVKEWYPGRECDTSNEHEIMAAVSNLARIHRLMLLNSGERIKAGSSAVRTEYLSKEQEDNVIQDSKDGAVKTIEPQECQDILESEKKIVRMQRPDPLKEVHAQNAELRKIRTFVRRRNDKGEFERQFLQVFDQYYAQAEEAEARLENLKEQLEKEWERHPGSVCHGDYDHHNILMSGYEIATVNFNRCRIDFQVNDLYRFMRKILEKQEWNMKLAVRMLDNYMKVNPLPETERKLLYAKMLYPEKFRKLANYYYGSNKALISKRFLDKLENINRQDAMRREFVTVFSGYC